MKGCKNTILFRYSEIGLKGKNLRFFEQILQQNILKALEHLDFLNHDNQVPHKVKIRFVQKQGIIEFVNFEVLSQEQIDKINQILQYIPGIQWWGVCQQVYDFNNLDTVLASLKDFFQKQFSGMQDKLSNSVIKIEVKRYDKSISFTSNDVWLGLMKYLRKDFSINTKTSNASTNIENTNTANSNTANTNTAHSNTANLHTANFNPAKSLFYHNNVLRYKIFVYSNYLQVIKLYSGIGGLPVGSSGRGLVLFSGGIDSPVSAFLLARRGIKFDLLHFTPKDSQTIRKTKIYKLWLQLRKINPYTRLFIAKIPFVQQLVQQNKVFTIYNPMIFFKHIIFRVAQDFARKLYKNKDFVLISGDSLGQVSSQTISNLRATELLLDKQILVLRPCIGLNKQEIINLATFLGTYDLSIQEYDDCCSRLSKTSKTQTDIVKFVKQDEQLGIEQIIQQSLQTVKEVVV